jgi:hypothetical protein
MVKGGNQLALGEVARGAEDDEEVRLDVWHVRGRIKGCRLKVGSDGGAGFKRECLSEAKQIFGLYGHFDRGNLRFPAPNRRPEWRNLIQRSENRIPTHSSFESNRPPKRRRVFHSTITHLISLGAVSSNPFGKESFRAERSRQSQIARVEESL